MTLFEEEAESEGFEAASLCLRTALDVYMNCARKRLWDAEHWDEGYVVRLASAYARAFEALEALRLAR